MTGRHMTLRCDGNSTEHVAFGGPIFYGHAASGFNEKADHPGNVFWPQALAANKVYECSTASSATGRWSIDCRAKKTWRFTAAAKNSPACRWPT